LSSSLAWLKRTRCLRSADTLQNHLIETASTQTGSLLIWDSGEYEVLEKSSSKATKDSETDPDSQSFSPASTAYACLSEPEKLALAFSHRKIRLRLHGTRLPRNYTLYLRLTKENDCSTQPKAPAFKRRRKVTIPPPAPSRSRRNSTTSTSSSSPSSQQESDVSTATRTPAHRRLRYTVSSLKRTASPPHRDRAFAASTASKLESMASETTSAQISVRKTSKSISEHTIGDEEAAGASGSDEDEAIRRNNAYPGASNTVGSIHQRKWYMSMDRTLSGFVPIPTPKDINHHARTWWIPRTRIDLGKGGSGQEAQGAEGFDRFHVLGREHEKSVVTGRLAAEILTDEGVESYVPRGRWRAVTE